MKKTFKGFTLVECIIAMAILAIAMMTLGAIEARVAARNNFNHFNNTSLANQMAYVESYTNSESVALYYGGGALPVKDPHKTSDKMPPHKHVSSNQGTTAYVQIEKLDSSGNPVTNNTYSFPVDVYIMYSRDTHNTASKNVTITSSGTDKGKRNESANPNYGTMYAEDNSNLRYKYILGHSK